MKDIEAAQVRLQARIPGSRNLLTKKHPSSHTELRLTCIINPIWWSCNLRGGRSLLLCLVLTLESLFVVKITIQHSRSYEENHNKSDGPGKAEDQMYYLQAHQEFLLCHGNEDNVLHDQDF